MRAGQHLAYPRRTGWLSRQFLLDQRQQLRDHAAEFQPTKLAYSLPVGFEFGWLLLYTPGWPKCWPPTCRAGSGRRLTGSHGTTVSIQLSGNGRLDVELGLEAGAARLESIMPNGIGVQLPG